MGRKWHQFVYGTYRRLRLRNNLYCVEWGVKLYSLTYRRHVGGTLYCGNVTSKAVCEPSCVVLSTSRNTRLLQIIQAWEFSDFHMLAHTLRIPPTWRHRFTVQFSGVTFTSFSSLFDRRRCLHGRWSCRRRSDSFPSGFRSSARSCAHVDALL